MRIFGLIGFPLSHSFSKNFFTDKFANENLYDCRYENFSIPEIGQLKELLKSNPYLSGLNVTIPYKEKILPYLDEVDEIASKIGAVNVVKVERKGDGFSLIGYNTDYYGFYESIKPRLLPNHKKALILGTGGASKAVAFALGKLNIEYFFISRNSSQEKRVQYSDLNETILKEHKLIVNTTPLGMFPDIETFPDIPYNYIANDYFLYDLVYNPEITIFLQRGMKAGAICKNGIEMLHLQANKAWDIWNL